MLERFTDRARRVLVLAQHEATSYGHTWIGCEHLLVGLLAVDDGVAAVLLTDAGVRLDDVRSALVAAVGDHRDRPDDETALASIGIDLAEVRSQVESAFGPGALPSRAESPPFTPKARDAVERAVTEANRLRHYSYVATEHLLLGLLAHGDNVAVTILAGLGIDLDEVRAATIAQVAPAIVRLGEVERAITRVHERLHKIELGGADVTTTRRRFGDDVRAARVDDQDAGQASLARLLDDLERAVAAADDELARLSP